MLDEVIKQNFGDKIYNGTSGNVIIFLSSLTFESRKHPYPAQCSSEKKYLSQKICQNKIMNGVEHIIFSGALFIDAYVCFFYFSFKLSVQKLDID